MPFLFMHRPSMIGRQSILFKNIKTITIFLFFITIGFGFFYLFYQVKEAKTSTLNVYEKIALKRNVNYLIIGDSIGRGSGAENQNLTWFTQWEALIKQKYKIEPHRHSIVQSGATAFEGLYLFNKANKPATVDLVILIFGENDRKYMNAKQFSFYYESLIREVKTIYPTAELITITESCLKSELFAEAIESIANQYHSNHIDMRIPFQNSEKTTTELTSDFIHPNGLGYRLYAEAILFAIEKGYLTKKQVATIPQSIDVDRNLNIEVKEIHQYKEKNKQFIKLNGYYSSRDKGASITYSFTGPNLGVKVFKSEQGGEMDVFVDGKFVRRVSTWWPINRERTLYLTSDLSNGEHEVTFIVTGTKSTKNNNTENPIVQLSSIVVIE